VLEYSYNKWRKKNGFSYRSYKQLEEFPQDGRVLVLGGGGVIKNRKFISVDLTQPSAETRVMAPDL